MTTNARNIFKTPEHFEQIEAQGYVILSLFSKADLAEFEAIFQYYFPETPPAFFSSSYLPDFDLKKEISQKIEAIMLPRLAEHFKNYRCLGAAFLSKAPDPNSELPMHQDWTIVDESTYLAANLWTPITTLTEENGTLEVLPGSHKTFRALRAPTLPFSGNTLRDQIKDHLVPLYLKPGEVAVLDQALVHYSRNNRSDNARLAFTTGLISKDAPLHFHFWDKETSELETLAMDDDFLFRWKNFFEDIFKRPTFGQSIGKKHFKPEMFSEERLFQTMGVDRPISEPAKKEAPASGLSWNRMLNKLFGK